MTPPARVRAAARAWSFGYDLLGLLVAGACTCAAILVGRERSARLRERLGIYEPAANPALRGTVIWLHAASVGEVLVAEPLVAALRARRPELRFVVTCQTATGLAQASRLAAEERHYFPIDARFVVRRVLARFRPALFLFVETEIWPRLLLELHAAGIPSAMAAARLSDRSFRRYRRARRLFEPALATLACVCVRDEASLGRLRALGVPTERSLLCGDIKMDALDEIAVAGTPDALAGRVEGEPVLFAVSTHDGEERIVLEAFSRVRLEHPTTRLVLAPRHPRRADAVCALAATHGRVARWSRAGCAERFDVLVIDTTGDARTFFPAADCVFVGGSLVDVGGHNLAEPAAFGVPCAVGPRLESVQHQAALLEAAGAMVVVANAEELAATWSRWLGNPDEGRRIGHAARAVVMAQRGAIARTVSALEPLLAHAGSGAAT